jgi:AcrR family transcriptional regulator
MESSPPLPAAPAKRRAAYIDEIADIVLREGLEVLALRGLAERLGTSARMLMYYFGSKETLVVEVAALLSLRLQTKLARFSAAERRSPVQFLTTVLQMTRDPDLSPFMSVMTELVARGARGQKPYDRLAEELVADWVAWIDSRLVEPPRPGQAMALLAIVEGITILDSATRGQTQAAGDFLLNMVEAAGR